MQNPFTADLPFFYPSSVLLLDDEEQFLQSLKGLLSLDHAVVGYSSVEHALNFVRRSQAIVNDHFQLLDRASGYADLESGMAGDHMVLFRSTNLHDVAFSPRRYGLTSVVVVDEVMPEMRGLEFCHLLQDTGIKTILLTGEMDDPAKTIAAFNSGKIDRYISKKDPNALSLVEQAIWELQLDYFTDMLSPLKAALKVSARHLLNSDQLEDLFDQVHSHFPFQEFYYHSRSGGYLLRNTAGETCICLFSAVNELKELADFISECGPGTPEQVKGLSEGQYVAWDFFDNFGTPDTWETRLTDLLFPSKIHNDIAWSLVPLDKAPYSDLPASISWSGYRKQLMSYPINWTEAA